MELRQRFGSTFLRRFENPGFGFGRLTHVVEPSLQYDYVPSVNQESLLQFDSVDFVSPQNRLTYRLTTRLMGRTQDGVQTYEVASLGVAQSLNLDPKTRAFSDVYLQALTPERVDQAVKNPQALFNGFRQATERRLSNMAVQGTIRLLPSVSLAETVAINVEQLDVEGVNSGLEWRFRDIFSVEAAHSYVLNGQVDGLVARLAWKVTKNISLDLLTRYDFQSSTFLENTPTLRITTCCWEARLRYTHLSKTINRSAQNNVQVLFDLKMPTQPAAR